MAGGDSNNAFLSSLVFGGLIVAVVMVLAVGFGMRSERVAVDLPTISTPR